MKQMPLFDKWCEKCGVHLTTEKKPEPDYIEWYSHGDGKTHVQCLHCNTGGRVQRPPRNFLVDKYHPVIYPRSTIDEKV